MPNLNLCQIIGHCGHPPEMRFTPSGKPVTTFSVATNSYSGTGDDRKEYTEWFSVIAWGKLAEICNERINKGDVVYVQGRLQTRSWDKDGETKYKTELVADKVQFFTKRSGEGATGGEAKETDTADVPF